MIDLFFSVLFFLLVIGASLLLVAAFAPGAITLALSLFRD